MTDHTPRIATAAAGHSHHPGRPARPQRRLRPAIPWATAALVVGLAACGGGNDEEQAAATDLALNAANAERVAGEAVHSLPVTVKGLSSLVSKQFVLERVQAAAAMRATQLRTMPKGGTTRPQAVTNSSSPCTTSGQSTVTVSQAVERKLTVGDFADQQFDACVQSGIESAGKARETVTAVSATQSIFEARGELTGFGSTEAGVSVLETGPYDLTVDRTNAAAPNISSSSNQAINVERRVNQKANAAYSFTAMKRSLVGDIAAGVITLNASYTVSGSFPALGATRFQISTPQNLSVQSGSGAITGTLKVAGTGGSTLLLTFLGDNVDSLRLDLDANGDGTIDQTQTRTTEQLVQLVLAP